MQKKEKEKTQPIMLQQYLISIDARLASTNSTVSVMAAVLLAQRRQMTLARCHYAHRINLIANRWFDVSPTPVTQQALHMPT